MHTTVKFKAICIPNSFEEIDFQLFVKTSFVFFVFKSTIRVKQILNTKCSYKANN